jgi:alcohol dehydrogenase class IV
VAIAAMLHHVVRWNTDFAGGRYAELMSMAGKTSEPLPERLRELARAGELGQSLRELGVPREDIPHLAAATAKEWTGTFNPRPFNSAAAQTLYETAY